MVPEPVGAVLVGVQVAWVLHWIRGVRKEYAR